MENNPLPEPSSITPQTPDASSTNFTSEPNNDPRWTVQPPAPSGGSSAVPVLVVAGVSMVSMCILGVLLGSWVLGLIGGLAALLLFHYVAWGWLFTRMVAREQKEELLRRAREDANLLPDPQRSRHF